MNKPAFVLFALGILFVITGCTFQGPVPAIAAPSTAAGTLTIIPSASPSALPPSGTHKCQDW